MKFRTGLLMGAVFVAGVAAGPVVGTLDHVAGWPIANAKAQSSGSGPSTSIP